MCAIHSQHAIDDARVSIEVALPIAMAKNGDGWRTWLRAALVEEPPCRRNDLQIRKVEAISQTPQQNEAAGEV